MWKCVPSSFWKIYFQQPLIAISKAIDVANGKSNVRPFYCLEEKYNERERERERQKEEKKNRTVNKIIKQKKMFVIPSTILSVFLLFFTPFHFSDQKVRSFTLIWSVFFIVFFYLLTFNSANRDERCAVSMKREKKCQWKAFLTSRVMAFNLCVDKEKFPEICLFFVLFYCWMSK